MIGGLRHRAAALAGDNVMPSAAALGLGVAALLGGLAAAHAPRAMAPLLGLAALLSLAQMVRGGTLRPLWAGGAGAVVVALAAWMAASAMWTLVGVPAFDNALRKGTMLLVVLLVVAMAGKAAGGRWLRLCFLSGMAALLPR